MPPQDVPCRGGAEPDLRSPVAVDGGQVDLAEHDVDDRVEDLTLVRDVVVQRHRLHAEVLGERADGQGSDPVRVGDRNGTLAGPAHD